MSKRANEIDKLVGKNIRIFRMAKGVSQTQLGDRIGVTFQQVQKYENGANRIGSGRLAKLADILDTPVGRFFTNGAPDRAGANDDVLTDALTSPYAVQMLTAFAKISSNDVRRSIVRLVEDIDKKPQR